MDKKQANPRKSKGFSVRRTPKILGKQRQNAPKKQGKSENEKKGKEIESPTENRGLRRSAARIRGENRKIRNADGENAENTDDRP